MLLLGSLHGFPPPNTQVAFIKGRYYLFPTTAEAERAQTTIFFLPKGQRLLMELERSNRVVISSRMWYTLLMWTTPAQNPTSYTDFLKESSSQVSRWPYTSNSMLMVGFPNISTGNREAHNRPFNTRTSKFSPRTDTYGFKLAFQGRGECCIKQNSKGKKPSLIFTPSWVSG